jgi:hypothetical protein
MFLLGADDCRTDSTTSSQSVIDTVREKYTRDEPVPVRGGEYVPQIRLA